MEPRTVIKDHLLLCEQVHTLLLEENTWLKTKKVAPDMDLITRKQQILPQLDESLANLKKLKPEYFSPFDDSKKLVGESHSKLLQIFYLDRGETRNYCSNYLNPAKGKPSTGSPRRQRNLGKFTIVFRAMPKSKVKNRENPKIPLRTVRERLIIRDRV